MDHHLGSVMTVKHRHSDFVEVFEDQNEFMNSGWCWFEEMIEGLWVNAELDDDTSEWTQDTLCSLFE